MLIVNSNLNCWHMVLVQSCLGCFNIINSCVLQVWFSCTQALYLSTPILQNSYRKRKYRDRVGGHHIQVMKEHTWQKRLISTQLRSRDSSRRAAGGGASNVIQLHTWLLWHWTHHSQNWQPPPPPPLTGNSVLGLTGVQGISHSQTDPRHFSNANINASISILTIKKLQN